MNKNRTGIIVVILVLLVLIFGALVLYSYVAKPILSNYSVNSYNQGANDVLNAMITQVQSQGYVQIPLNNNQSLILVPYLPSQASASQTGVQ